MLQIEQLTKSFDANRSDRPVLSNINFSLNPGRFTVLMGASGSGKSTFLQLVGGLDVPNSGQIHLWGMRISDLDESQRAKFRRSHIGYVFQESNLIEQLTVRENILLAGYLVSKKRKDVLIRAQWLLNQMEIGHLEHRLPSELSGGERQRSAIARAMINRPKLLLLDEPTGSLNSAASQSVLDCFKSLHQTGQSILMVTHHIPSALIGDEVYYMRDGKILDRLDLGNVDKTTSKKDLLTQWLDNVGW